MNPPAIARLIFLSALVIGCTDIALADEVRGPRVLNFAMVVLLAGLYALARRYPLAAAAGFLSSVLVLGTLLQSPTQQVLPFFGLLVIPFYVGGHSHGVRSRIGLVAMMIAPATVDALAADQDIGDVLFLPVLCFLSWLVGRGVRSRTELAVEQHEAAIRAQEAHDQETQRAVAAERRRIAREMHDIVAHSVSVMVVQAGGARRILDRDPPRAHAAALEIERTGRAALAEMRRMLGILQTTPGERAPQPGLGELEDLVESARAAGQPVELRQEGVRRSLPAGVDLAAYRVVQEGLTNALKHATGAPTEVLVRWRTRELRIEVSDAGASGAQPVNGTGHGLIGMRERVSLFGGSLDAGPRAGGGFALSATIPLEEASP